MCVTYMSLTEICTLIHLPYFSFFLFFFLDKKDNCYNLLLTQRLLKTIVVKYMKK